MIQRFTFAVNYLKLLQYNPSLQNFGDDGPSLTPINLHILHNLWLPDVEILDLKAFETHSVLSKLEGNFLKIFAETSKKGKVMN